MESQNKVDSTKPAVSMIEATVEYWRERYTDAAEKIGTAKNIQPILAEEDKMFEGVKGFYKVQNLQANTAGMTVTIKAVLIIEQHLKLVNSRPTAVS